MTKKGLWLMATLLVIVALSLAACAKAPTTTAPETSRTTAPTISTAPVATTTSAGAPKYGGMLTQRVTVDPAGFDDQIGLHQSLIPTGLYTNEELLQGDWAKGPFGTG